MNARAKSGGRRPRPERVSKGRPKGAVTPDDVDRVMELEGERQQAGYSPGWTYHRARESRLLLAYEHTLGSYADPAEKEYAPQRGRPLRQNEPLLAVEMIPQSCRVKSVRQILEAERWHSIAACVKERSGNRCEVCLGRGRRYAVGCHTVFDYDQHAGVQKLTGFVALCPGCAEGRYIHLAEAKGRYEVAYKRLLMVNRWMPEEADRHIARARALYERRCEVAWAQDFGRVEEANANRLWATTGGVKER